MMNKKKTNTSTAYEAIEMKQFRFSYLENKVLYNVYVKRGQTDEPSKMYV